MSCPSCSAFLDIIPDQGCSKYLLHEFSFGTGIQVAVLCSNCPGLRPPEVSVQDDRARVDMLQLICMSIHIRYCMYIRTYMPT
jgi:hypothetical protein